MSPKNIEINRDRQNDVVCAFVKGADREHARNMDVNSDVVISVDFKSRSIVGITIDDFSRVFPQWKDLGDWELMEKFDVFIEFLNSTHTQLSPSK